MAGFDPMIQRVCLALACALTLVTLWQAPQHPQLVSLSDPVALAAANQVQLTLKIADEDSGLQVQAKRKVTTGQSALEALEATVPVKSKNYPGIGLRILGLCNVEPARGKYWALFVDGKYAETGIADLKIEKEIVIEWKTQK